MVRRGLREEYGSWKTARNRVASTLLAFGFSESIDSPSKEMDPLVTG